jgi:CheY-like chemotaxis protein
MRQPHLLVMDDEPEFAEIVRKVAEGMGFAVVAPRNAAEFKARFKELRPEIVMVDVIMPDVDGIELVSWLVANQCAAQVLIVTGYDPSYARAAETLAKVQGMMRVSTLAKPLKLAELRAALAESGG